MSLVSFKPWIFHIWLTQLQWSIHIQNFSTRNIYSSGRCCRWYISSSVTATRYLQRYGSCYNSPTCDAPWAPLVQHHCRPCQLCPWYSTEATNTHCHCDAFSAQCSRGKSKTKALHAMHVTIWASGCFLLHQWPEFFSIKYFLVILFTYTTKLKY